MNRRLWELDALRGLMLVLMTVTHLPTRFSSPLGQPFGFVSAAEGFVMLSAVMAGMVYTARERREGEEVMRVAFLKRAWKIYLCQAALLAFLFTAIAAIGLVSRQDAVTNMIAFYIDHTLLAFVTGFLLIYNPPLMDILPMYIVFMLLSPVLLIQGIHRGWTGILTVSVLLWTAAQFGLSHVVYDGIVALTGLKVPFPQTGSFEILGWQFLWVLGLWIGSGRSMVKNPPPIVFPGWMVKAAIVIGIVGLVWRHGVGQVPFPSMPGTDGWNLPFDKWQLAPLRLINFFALMVLTVHFAPWLTTRLPRLPFLETMGAASLPVFCAHLVLALLLLAFLGAGGRSWAADSVIMAGSLLILYGVARVTQQIDRGAAALKQRRQPSSPKVSVQPLPPTGSTTR